jgi:CPA1 family monovalent cation:H+ antiporter
LVIEQVIGILVSVTAISSFINYRYLKLPKTIGLTLIALVLSLLVAGLGKLGWNVDGFATQLLDGIGFTDTFLHGMLGFLLFAASLHVNTMELAKHKTIVGLLATVSVVLSTIFIGFCTFGLTQFLSIEIPLEYCLVFGALISPTDPIATLAILKTVNAPKALEMKIAGESLFNDGMGIVVFIILLGIASGTHGSWTIQEATLFFMRQGFGGILLGLVMGWLAAKLLRTIDNSEVAIIVTLAIVTGGYSFAHSVVNVSGAICMTVSGLVVGGLLQNGKMSKDTIHRLDAFWELVDELLNSILFVLIGLEFLRLHFTLDTTLAAIGAIVITIAARWISVAIPVGCVSIFRKFSSNVVLVMTWGGLRGGISIALALTVPQGPVRDFIVSITYAVVLFSITVQGLTVGRLVQVLTGRYTPKSIIFEGTPRLEPGEIVNAPNA